MQISADGHCLYAAVADQLFLLGLIKEVSQSSSSLSYSAASLTGSFSRAQNNYQVTRDAAADYILSHSDDFLPFLPSASGEDGDGAEDDGMMTPEGMAEYCRRIKESGEWGGEPEVSRATTTSHVRVPLRRELTVSGCYVYRSWPCRERSAFRSTWSRLGRRRLWCTRLIRTRSMRSRQRRQRSSGGASSRSTRGQSLRLARCSCL